MKVRNIIKILIISFCAFSAIACHKSSKPDADLAEPASAPGAPTISAPTDGLVSPTGNVTISWSLTAHKGGEGTTWNVVDNEDTVFNSVEINNTSDGQNASTQLSLDPIEPSHILAVTLCNRDGCTSSTNTVKVSIAMPKHP